MDLTSQAQTHTSHMNNQITAITFGQVKHETD
jgi:hypothetical protein